MEALSPTMEEGQVVNWLVSEGDEVSNGDVLAEIETDKATMELTARGAGTLLKILVGEGGTAPVGDVIAVIGEEGEDISDLVGEAGEGPGAEEEEAAEEPDAAEEEAEAAGAEAGEEEEAGAEEEGEGEGAEAERAAAERGEAAELQKETGREGGRIKASPLARRLAEEAGLDLGSVEGSGPAGRIVKKDVEEARSRAEEAEAGAPPAGKAAREPIPEWTGEVPEEEYEEVSLSQMRKTIARRLTRSIGPVPHFFLTVDVDMTRVMAARKRMNAYLEERGEKVSVNDIILKATAAALARHPECNAAWHDDHIRRYHVVHLGVAVAVEEGLITPVVRHADRKGVVRIGREVREMAARAREKKLKPEEYTGATFSVSNLGMFGIHEFTAVINPPEAGILAIGGVKEEPVVQDGEVVTRPQMRVTMSCDHRVIDGATGSRFLQTLTEMLEEPASIIL